jgi:hypothetical protein
LGAVFYRIITGDAPVYATTRGTALVEGRPDPLKPVRILGHGRYPDPLLRTIDWALALNRQARPATVTQWRTALAQAVPRKSGWMRRWPVRIPGWRGMTLAGVLLMMSMAGVAVWRHHNGWFDGTLWDSIRAWEHDLSDGTHTLIRQAKRGNATAQYQLGINYLMGTGGMKQDDQTAFHWIEQAARAGDAQAQYVLGMMYDRGRGVDQNNPQAVQWFLKAGDQGVDKPPEPLHGW